MRIIVRTLAVALVFVAGGIALRYPTWPLHDSFVTAQNPKTRAERALRPRVAVPVQQAPDLDVVDVDTIVMSRTVVAAKPTPAQPVIQTAGGRLQLFDTIRGGITPKSVTHVPGGRFLAQNMMYSHTMTVYDRNRELVATVDDQVRLDGFGFDQYAGMTHAGSPVEAVATSDGTTAFVSNYKMYGPGFDRPGTDSCNGGGWDESFVYRLDLATYEVVDAIRVGAVPKHLALTPDDSHLLVSNWCSSDLSIIDTITGEETGRVSIGRYPRGVAIDPTGETAFVAVMGGRDIARLSLNDLTISWLRDVGGSPRHLVLAPDGSALYVSLNADGMVTKLDPESGEVLGSVSTGYAPRSMAISADGASLYVTNYGSDSLSKVDAVQMIEVQEVPTDHHPIGVTTDAETGDVWVANYSGSIMVFADVVNS